MNTLVFVLHIPLLISAKYFFLHSTEITAHSPRFIPILTGTFCTDYRVKITHGKSCNTTTHIQRERNKEKKAAHETIKTQY